LISHPVHVTVVTGEVASAVQLEDELAERERLTGSVTWYDGDHD
jgi:hypothetical protein